MKSEEFEKLKKQFAKLSSKRRWELMDPYVFGNFYIGDDVTPVKTYYPPVSPVRAIQFMIMSNLIFSASTHIIRNNVVVLLANGSEKNNKESVYVECLVVNRNELNEFVGMVNPKLSRRYFDWVKAEFKNKLILEAEEEI